MGVLRVEVTIRKGQMKGLPNTTTQPLGLTTFGRGQGECENGWSHFSAPGATAEHVNISVLGLFIHSTASNAAVMDFFGNIVSARFFALYPNPENAEEVLLVNTGMRNAWLCPNGREKEKLHRSSLGTKQEQRIATASGLLAAPGGDVQVKTDNIWSSSAYKIDRIDGDVVYFTGSDGEMQVPLVDAASRCRPVSIVLGAGDKIKVPLDRSSTTWLEMSACIDLSCCYNPLPIPAAVTVLTNDCRLRHLVNNFTSDQLAEVRSLIKNPKY